MRVEIEITEKVIRTNRYVLEVDDEDEGESILDRIADDIKDVAHPDDVTSIISEAGYEIKDIIYGAEEAAEYEVN